MIHLSGSTFNIYNSGQLFFKLPTFYLFKFQINNGVCWGVTPTEYFDSFNLSTSGTKLSLQDKFKEFSIFEFYFLFFFKRVTFRGKSYRIRYFKKINKFTLNFNYSHWTKVKLNSNWSISRRKKKKERDRQRYLLLTTNYSILPGFINFFKNIRFFNCYTMRGLRFRSQPIIRRFGKLSQHVSILH